MVGVISAKDAPFLLFFIVTTMALTLISCLTVGKFIANRSQALAVLACGLTVPIVMAIAVVATLLWWPSGPPPGTDGPGLDAASLRISSLS
jgi:hypothetical protein